MNIIILGVRIIEDSDNRGSDNRGCTVVAYSIIRSRKLCDRGWCPFIYIYRNLQGWVQTRGV